MSDSRSPIRCCHRDCRLVVWDWQGESLQVNASSATCSGCRKMILCVEHFEEVFQAQKGISCPNCGGTEWWVCLFEPARLSADLAASVRSAGGHIERRFAAADIGGPKPSTPVGRSQPNVSEGDGSVTPKWSLVENRDQPAGTRHLSGRLSVRDDSNGSQLFLGKDEVGGLVRGRISRGALSPSGSRITVEFTPFGARSQMLNWFDGLDSSGLLSSPHGSSLRAPAFIDERRFVYLASTPDGRHELREGTFEGRHQVRSRRIAPLGLLMADPTPPVVVQHSECVVVSELDATGHAITMVRLADGRKTLLAGGLEQPRRLVASPRGSAVAWIGSDGEVRCSPAPTLPARVLGSTQRTQIGISSDGRQVAWIGEGVMEIADIRTGRLRRKRLENQVLDLEWSIAGNA